MKKTYIIRMLRTVMLMVVLLAGVNQVCMAKQTKAKPQWVSKGESSLNKHRSNETYYFKIIQNVGTNIAQLRKDNPKALAEFIGTNNQIEGMAVTEVSNSMTKTGVASKNDFNIVFKNKFSSEAFNASLIDEWWEPTTSSTGARQYNYYALYAVSAVGGETPVYDRFEVTRSYGAAPAFMSIIPGVGQLYKGQKLKGGLMLGGAVIGAGAIIFCENRRAYYRTRIIEQPKFARHYSQKSDNWKTGRNVAIGFTGALVAWSIIDAAVTPGVTRIKISPNTSVGIRPTALATPSGVGLGASFAFNF